MSRRNDAVSKLLRTTGFYHSLGDKRRQLQMTTLMRQAYDLGASHQRELDRATAPLAAASAEPPRATARPVEWVPNA